MCLPAGDRSLAEKPDAFGCLRENKGNHRALLFSVMEGAGAACTALSHPVWLLPVLLWARTCLCRCAGSWVVLNPACSSFLGNHKIKIRQTYPASFVCRYFLIGLFINIIKVYGIQYYIKKIPFLNCFCSSQFFFTCAEVRSFRRKNFTCHKIITSTLLQDEISATLGVIDLIIELLVYEYSP